MSTTHPAAALAIKAAKGYRTWGDAAARAFIKRTGANIHLVRLARMLDAAEQAAIRHRCTP